MHAVNPAKFYLILLLCALPTILYGQHIDSLPCFSTPLSIPATGINKVLCLKNGNTALLHFESEQSILLKVFDSTGHQLASKLHQCRHLDIYKLREAVYKGLFEVNGEIVLFTVQVRLNKHRLIRLRFSDTNGSLIEEKIVGASKSLSRPTSFYVMNCKGVEGYAILCCADAPQFLYSNIYVEYYNNSHEITKKVPLEIDRKKYDHLKVTSAEMLPEGICITLGLDKLKLNGTLSGIGNDPTDDIYDHHFLMYYIPNGSLIAKSKTINTSESLFPYYAKYSYNAFAKTLNVLMLSYLPVTYKFGIGWKYGALTEQLFFKLDENDLSLNYKWVKNRLASEYLYGKADTTHYYAGLPVKMVTNQYGMTTIFSMAHTIAQPGDLGYRDYRFTYLGPIAITQFDDDGNELWGTVLPVIQGYYGVYPAYLIGRKQNYMTGLQQVIYERQFISFNSYCHNTNCYVIYNEYNKNFKNTITAPGDTIFSIHNTNACYYKLDKKKNLTKHYLFGTPKRNEYHTSFIEGADFDEERGIYATLVQRTKGEYTSLVMGWVKLH